jgi:hypothetical protein
MQDADTSLLGVANVATPHAARYLTQLCKHFQHKGIAAQAGETGSLVFPDLGACRMQAGAGILTLTVEALDAARREHLQDVVARHLRRFAFRENLECIWNEAAARFVLPDTEARQ